MEPFLHRKTRVFFYSDLLTPYWSLWWSTSPLVRSLFWDIDLIRIFRSRLGVLLPFFISFPILSPSLDNIQIFFNYFLTVCDSVIVSLRIPARRWDEYIGIWMSIKIQNGVFWSAWIAIDFSLTQSNEKLFLSNVSESVRDRYSRFPAMWLFILERDQRKEKWKTDWLTRHFVIHRFRRGGRAVKALDC